MWTELASNVTMKAAAVSHVPEASLGSLVDMVGTYMDALPDLDDPALLSFFAAFFSAVFVCSIWFVQRRRDATSTTTEPLLGGAA